MKNFKLFINKLKLLMLCLVAAGFLTLVMLVVSCAILFFIQEALAPIANVTNGEEVECEFLETSEELNQPKEEEPIKELKVPIEQEKQRQTTTIEKTKEEPPPVAKPNYSILNFKTQGVIKNFNGFNWSYYGNPAVYEKDCVHGSDGAFRYQGLLVLASQHHAKGTILQTPFGENGIVLDWCSTPGMIDCYMRF